MMMIIACFCTFTRFKIPETFSCVSKKRIAFEEIYVSATESQLGPIFKNTLWKNWKLLQLFHKRKGFKGFSCQVKYKKYSLSIVIKN